MTHRRRLVTTRGKAMDERGEHVTNARCLITTDLHRNKNGEHHD